jgi:CTP synthase
MAEAEKPVTIGVVGKYVALADAYISITEALRHAGIVNDAKVEVRLINSEEVEAGNVAELLADCDGLLVPGGFGNRGIEGKILAVHYARKHKMPFLGVCLGMHMAVVEFARNVLGYAEANSGEFDEATPHPVIHIMPEQEDITDKGGTMRLGLYPCKLGEGTLCRELYGQELIYERHRHRYELNNQYREELAEHGMVIAGLSPDDKLAEIVELPRDKHPWFVAVQFHPEFKSRPNRPHPLFAGLVKAALERREQGE